MAKKEYDTFTDNPQTVPATVMEVSLAIRELTPDDRKKMYLTRYVKANVCGDPDKMPEGDVLWLRWQRGKLYPKPAAIKILGELGEFMPRGIPLFQT